MTAELRDLLRQGGWGGGRGGGRGGGAVASSTRVGIGKKKPAEGQGSRADTEEAKSGRTL